VLDPPKLIRSRTELEEGTRKHIDLNRLAIQLVKKGGILLTCCCAGLLDGPAFMQVVQSAGHQSRRQPLPRPSRTNLRIPFRSNGPSRCDALPRNRLSESLLVPNPLTIDPVTEPPSFNLKRIVPIRILAPDLEP
jgi:hypothetical protein